MPQVKYPDGFRTKKIDKRICMLQIRIHNNYVQNYVLRNCSFAFQKVEYKEKKLMFIGTINSTMYGSLNSGAELKQHGNVDKDDN